MTNRTTAVRRVVIIGVVGLLASLLGDVVDAQPRNSRFICEGRQATVVLELGQQPTGNGDVILGTSGNDTINGGGGNDIICGAGGNDKLIGGPGNDIVYGNEGNDTLKGNAGFDTLDGGPGRDILKGGSGSDRILGGPGKDTMAGGSGTGDVCNGGPGKDTKNNCGKVRKACPETPVTPFEIPVGAKKVKDANSGCQMFEATARPGTSSVFKLQQVDGASFAYGVQTHCGSWELMVTGRDTPLSEASVCSSDPAFRSAGAAAWTFITTGEMTLTINHEGEHTEPFRVWFFNYNEPATKAAPSMPQSTCKNVPVQLETMPKRSWVATQKGCPVINSRHVLRLKKDPYTMQLAAGDTVSVIGKGSCGSMSIRPEGSFNYVAEQLDTCAKGTSFTVGSAGTYLIEVGLNFGPGPYSLQFFRS